MGCVTSSSTHCALHHRPMSPPPEQQDFAEDAVQTRRSSIPNPIAGPSPQADQHAEAEDIEEEDELKWSTSAQLSDEPPLQYLSHTSPSLPGRRTSIAAQPAGLCWREFTPLTTTIAPTLAFSSGSSEFASINGVTFSSCSSSHSAGSGASSFNVDPRDSHVPGMVEHTAPLPATSAEAAFKPADW